jgi:dihydroxyacetone kinase-like protein
MSETALRGLDAPGLTASLVAMCDAMEGHVEELTHADQAIGDGDHGLGVQRGLKAAREAIKGDAASADDVGIVLERFGSAMLMSMGGASGAVYGSLFRRGARNLKGQGTFHAAGLATFLEDGLAGVQERGGAKVGDKTLVDPLAAAAASARKHAAEALGVAFDAVAAASEAGAEGTRDMLATMGRARTMGERTIGHIDPGALSFAFMMRAWSDAVNVVAPSA